MKMENKHIACTVKDCAYNNRECEHCTLDEIKICNCNFKEDKEDTMCDSYKQNKNQNKF